MSKNETKKIHYDIGNINEVYDVYHTNIRYEHPENEKYICRYCGNSGKNKFKSKAHLIPEFTGSKDLFAYNECKECNHKFGVNYENSLRNFGVKNIYIPIKGKGGFKKHKDFSKDTVTQFKDEKTLVTKVNSGEYNDEIVDGKMKLIAMSYPFIPLYVYKSLVKIALSLLKIEDLENFKDTFDWISDINKQEAHLIPLTLVMNDEAKPPLLRPIAILLKKKINYNCPEFSFLFSWGFYNFQIFLPLNRNDNTLDYSNFHLPIRPDFVRKTKDGRIKFNHLEMNSLNTFKVENKISVPFIPSKEYIEKYGNQ
jgi:hypothetical protein